MKITKSNGEYLELRNLDYESLKIKEDEFNWLYILFSVQNEYMKWWEIDACMTSSDLKRLADWFKDLSFGYTIEDLFFTNEQYFHFELLSKNESTMTIKVCFIQHLAPTYFHENGIECFITFDLTSSELKQISDSLERDYLNTPIRNLDRIYLNIPSREDRKKNKENPTINQKIIIE